MLDVQLSANPSYERTQAQPCAPQKTQTPDCSCRTVQSVLDVHLAAASFTNPSFSVQCEQGQAPAEGAAGADCSRRGSHEAEAPAEEPAVRHLLPQGQWAHAAPKTALYAPSWLLLSVWPASAHLHYPHRWVCIAAHMLQCQQLPHLPLPSASVVALAAWRDAVEEVPSLTSDFQSLPSLPVRETLCLTLPLPTAVCRGTSAAQRQLCRVPPAPSAA